MALACYRDNEDGTLTGRGPSNDANSVRCQALSISGSTLLRHADATLYADDSADLFEPISVELVGPGIGLVCYNDWVEADAQGQSVCQTLAVSLDSISTANRVAFRTIWSSYTQLTLSAFSHSVSWGALACYSDTDDVYGFGQGAGVCRLVTPVDSSLDSAATTRAQVVIEPGGSVHVHEGGKLVVG